MEDFYKEIVAITSDNEISKTRDILIRRIDELVGIILDGSKLNIQTSAECGRKEAFIALFGVDCQYSMMIKMIDFFDMNEEIVQKYSDLNVETIMDRLRLEMSPFRVEFGVIDDKYCFIKAFWD